MMNEPTTTPCIGICSTVYGDDICRGCKRTADEVIDWNSFEDEQKLSILARLDAHTTRITQAAFEVFDEDLLTQTLVDMNLRHRSTQPALSKAFRLLQHLADDDISKCEQYGIRCVDLQGHADIKTLIHALDDTLYADMEVWFTNESA